jgi:hypothetical protein
MFFAGTDPLLIAIPRKTSHACATPAYFQYLRRSPGKRMAQDGGAEMTFFFKRFK